MKVPGTDNVVSADYHCQSWKPYNICIEFVGLFDCTCDSVPPSNRLH